MPETRDTSIAGQRFPQRLDDRNAAGDRRLEAERDAASPRPAAASASAVMGQQRLVGGDDGLAGRERRLDSRLALSVRAADQLDDAIHLPGARQRHGVVEPLERQRYRRRDPARGRGRETAVTRISRPQRAAIAPRALRSAECDRRSADGAEAGDADRRVK